MNYEKLQVSGLFPKAWYLGGLNQVILGIPETNSVGEDIPKRSIATKNRS